MLIIKNCIYALKTILLDTNKFMASKRVLVVLVSMAYVLFTNMNCNKGLQPPQTQADGLPLETQEGKNTFGCFWNDTLWLPKGFLTVPPTYSTFLSDSNWVHISFCNVDRDETFTFYIPIKQVGYYELDESNSNEIRIIRNGYDYKCSYPKGLKINITKFLKPKIDRTSYIKGIISGTFSSKFYKIKQGGKDIDTTDSIVIRKAVFDLEVN